MVQRDHAVAGRLFWTIFDTKTRRYPETVAPKPQIAGQFHEAVIRPSCWERHIDRGLCLEKYTKNSQEGS
jgi:hypothetical protein